MEKQIAMKLGDKLEVGSDASGITGLPFKALQHAANTCARVGQGACRYVVAVVRSSLDVL
jgi:hypothetical protein